MAEMKISNTLVNDTSTGEIAYVEQLKDRLLKNYINTLETKDKNRIPADIKAEAGVFQERLNEFFIKHWVDFQAFLLDEGVDPTVIDSWAEVQEFLEGLPDDEAMWLKTKLQQLDNRITAMDIPDGGAYDVSADHVDGGGVYARYASLSAAIAAIASEDRKPGMTIRFINSNTGTYEQWRYIGTAVEGSPNPFVDTSNWQGTDDTVTEDSTNLVESGAVFDAIDNVAFSTNEKINTIGIDSTPTAVSNNLVTSGGVKEELVLGSVYDVSAHNGGTTFASLSALLSAANLNILIPTNVRKGGMSIKFVQSSDNKYVQYRYMPSDAATVATFTNVNNWQGVDAEPTYGGHNLVESGGVFDSIIHITGGLKTIILSELVESLGVVNTNAWAGTTSSAYKHKFLSVNAGESYKVIAGANGAQIGFFTQKDVSPANGDPASLCSGYSIIEIAANSDILVGIPDTCTYLYIATKRTNNMEPTIQQIIQGEIPDYSDELGTKEGIFIEGLSQTNGAINSDSKKWAGTTSNKYKHCYLPVNSGEIYSIKNNISSFISFVPVTQIDVSPANDDTPSYCVGYSNVIKLNANEIAKIVIPNDCHYLYFTTLWNNVKKRYTISKETNGAIQQEIDTIKGNISVLDDSVEKLDKYTLSTFIIGKGNTYSSRLIYGLKSGYKYRIVIKNPSWNHSSVTSVSVNAFSVQNSYNGTLSYLVQENINSQGVFPTIKDYYDFTVPTNSDYVLVGLRANTSEEVEFMVIYTPLLQMMDVSFNSNLHSGLKDWKTPCERFAALFSSDVYDDVSAVENYDSFLFFTDPHTQYDPWSKSYEEYMSQIQKVYNSTPTEFVLCGGDWLGHGDTPDEASFKLGLVAKTCYTMLPKCYMLVGNHDTNYQGKKDSESQDFTTRLENASIENLWYYWNKKKAYYTIESRNTKFYCFDTGIESQPLDSYDNYGYEQASWFAQSLVTETSAHIAIALHIYLMDTGSGMQPLTALLMQIAAAYNGRGSITVMSSTYDFSEATGKIEFVIAGHQHSDQVYTYTEGNVSIPVIVTLDTGNGTTFPTDASFDLVFVDYDNRKINCIRVGSGLDRVINLT